jgi:ribosomal protein S18 acetylase RimI-like enzyme
VSTLTVRPAEERDRAAIDALHEANWGSPYVVAHGERVDLRTLPTLVAQADNTIGALVYRLNPDHTLEVWSLAATANGTGVGTALLEAAATTARQNNKTTLWLITTNDNTRALRFYQRRGLRIAAVDPGAVDRSRATIKPEIPLVGDDGIEIHDEIRLEMAL